MFALLLFRKLMRLTILELEVPLSGLLLGLCGILSTLFVVTRLPLFLSSTMGLDLSLAANLLLPLLLRFHLMLLLDIPQLHLVVNDLLDLFALFVPNFLNRFQLFFEDALFAHG